MLDTWQYVLLLVTLVATGWCFFRIGSDSGYYKGYTQGWHDGIDVVEKAQIDVMKKKGSSVTPPKTPTST